METKRLLIRPFCEEDLEALYELAKQIDVGIHAGWPPHKSKEETKGVLNNILMLNHTFAIIEKQSKQLIGSCSLQKDALRSNPLVLMLGYWIGKEYWGRGYMSEAAVCIIRYGFQKLGIHIISAYCYDYNERSKRVIEKMGFQKEGMLRQAVLRYDGAIIDEYLYSITREEFFQNNL